MTHDDNELHRQRMARQKEAFEERKAKATRDKGLIVVHTGAGKGKTTAALGLAFRALGQGMRVGIVQFIKGAIPTGEAALAARLADLGLAMHTMGDGFTWNTQDREQDTASARRAWDKALSLLHDPTFDLVILDELNVVIKHGYLPLDEALDDAPRVVGPEQFHDVQELRGPFRVPAAVPDEQHRWFHGRATFV